MESSLSINLSLQDTSSGSPTSPRKKSFSSISPELFVENLPQIKSSKDATIDFYNSHSVKFSNEDSNENMQTPFQTIAGSSTEKSSLRPRSNDIFLEDSEIKGSTSTDITKKKKNYFN